MPAMEPMTGITACGVGNLAGFWMDPAALQQLQSGTLIDMDNNVGVKFGVEFAGQGQNGKPIVTFAMGNELYKSTSTFDATEGRLIAFGRIEKSPTTGGTITSQMQLVGME